MATEGALWVPSSSGETQARNFHGAGEGDAIAKPSARLFIATTGRVKAIDLETALATKNLFVIEGRSLVDPQLEGE